jgi:spore coat protein A
MKLTRRDFLKLTGAGAAATFVPGVGSLGAIARPGYTARAFAATQGPGLSNPALQPKFVNPVANALDPSFIFSSPTNSYTIAVQQMTQYTGLVDAESQPVSTTVWGYGLNGPGGTWPGMTLQARSGTPIEVLWQNKIPKGPYLLTGKDNSDLGYDDFTSHSVVDTSLHWAYSLSGYEDYTIEQTGVPTVPHLHGGHTDFQYDGNPEFFFSPGHAVRGPQWVDKKFVYHNDQPAGTLWYHDHALGITRLNVYTGMAGFYILRDDDDTGAADNPLDLPAFPYEAAFAVQDRMFKSEGELFYPAFPGDPFYADFITDEGADLDSFPGGGPTALAEFFGDHMLVNGTAWPKMDVEPRNYRFRFLNGCDSRFLVTQFVEVPAGATDFADASGPLPFTVIGSDQGLASAPTEVDTLLMETGSRYDVIVDFTTVTPGSRVIMKNIGGDEPFGGDIPGPQVFGETDRVMAFDVVAPLDAGVPDVSPTGINYGPAVGQATRVRKVALFEGKDEYGRLQPLLGTAEPATDYDGNAIDWPSEPVYSSVGLEGQMEGSIAWHSPTTENPALGDTEEWEIWNMTGDAHPVHLHLVHFEVLGRALIKWDSATRNGEVVLDDEDQARGNGTYLMPQPVVQHNSVPGDPDTYGLGFRIGNPTTSNRPVRPPAEYVENAPKDMVTALPGQVTRIKAHFDKPGRYVWHCHILSHEDHEMMRVLHVGPGA